VLEAIEQEYGIRSGETTPDDELSLLTVRCVGACGLAPAVVLDGNVLGNVSAEGIRETISQRIAADRETVEQ
jgi:bidirectional [NiFe] hydrogenase diaphorase subunit